MGPRTGIDFWRTEKSRVACRHSNPKPSSQKPSHYTDYGIPAPSTVKSSGEPMENHERRTHVSTRAGKTHGVKTEDVMGRSDPYSCFISKPI